MLSFNFVCFFFFPFFLDWSKIWIDFRWIFCWVWWVSRHSFGQELSVKQWAQEAVGQRDLLAAYAGVRTEDVRGVRAPYLSVNHFQLLNRISTRLHWFLGLWHAGQIGGDNMFKMLYDANFTYDSSMPILENQVPMWPYTLDYEMPHDCVIPPCPTKSYPGDWISNGGG